MSTPKNPNLLYALPQLPLAEDMDADLLFAYREQMIQQGGSSPLGRSEMAWNDLEIGIATQDRAFVDLAFNTFHELDEDHAADLRYSPFLDVRTVLASETSFRQRVEPFTLTKKEINRVYRQVGTVIEACLSLELLGSNADKLPELIAYGGLIRNKDGRTLPHFSSPREKTGRRPGGHDLYSLKRSPEGRQKAALRLERRESGQGAFTDETVETVSIRSLVSQAIQAQDPVWVRAMAGRGQRAREDRWLRYVGAQLVRESRTGDSALKPEGRRVLEFLTSALCEVSGIERVVHERTSEKNEPLPNTSLTDQLKRKFDI